MEAGVVLPGLALGLAPFIMLASESVITVCFNASLLKYGGDVAVGAMTILSSAMQFSMLPMQGLGQGAQPITSYNYGARNADRVKKTFRLLLTTSLCYSMAVWLLIMLFPQVFAMIFYQRRTDRIHEVGASHLLRGHGYFRGADCMPDDIYLDRQCGGIDHRGGYA